MYRENCFLTLTYSNQHLPEHGSLTVRDWQLFAKRWRAEIAPRNFRFLQCGEYGDENKRAHHHAAIFGQAFMTDRVPIADSQKGYSQWESPQLTRLWAKGRCTISHLDYKAGAYIARYIMKKVTGKNAKEHYAEINQITGEIVDLKPEFITMSRRPGIGASWIKKYLTDVYPSDQVVIEGRICRPPKFYDIYYQKINPQGFKLLLDRRAKNAARFEEDNTPDRREDKETVKKQQIRTLIRS